MQPIMLKILPSIKTEKFIVLLLIPTIKHTPKFISNIQYFFVPNIGHFLFRTSVTLCSEHPVGFRSERRSFFIPNIRHLLFRTSCIFSFRTSRRFSFRTSGKLIVCFISDFEHPVIWSDVRKRQDEKGRTRN